MKNKVQVKEFFYNLWRFFTVHYAYNKMHTRAFKKKKFEIKKLSKEEKKEYRTYWRKVSPFVGCNSAMISKSLSGSFDKYIIPDAFYALYFEPILNNNQSAKFLENKSIYNKWFDKEFFPKDCFHKIDGVYFTYDFKVIENIDIYINNQLSENDFPLVVKPNKNSYGGANVNFVNSKNEVKELIDKFNDLVVQEKISQSELISELNKDGINSVRVCIYKDKKGLVHILNTCIRMGVDGSLDNTTAGGIGCNIKSSGVLNSYAVGKYCERYYKHPNSNYVFDNNSLPFYEELLKTSKEVAKRIIEVQLISLDMVLDANNIWRCIEINLFGQTIRFAQYAGQPYFGEKTQEIMDYVILAKNRKN